MSMDWDYERQQGLQILLSLVQLPLTKLWDPPVAEEDFVSVVGKPSLICLIESNLMELFTQLCV